MGDLYKYRNDRRVELVECNCLLSVSSRYLYKPPVTTLSILLQPILMGRSDKTLHV